MCSHNLDGCCCARWVFGLWHRQLPTAVKQAVSQHTFNKDTAKTVMELADKVFDSTRPAQAVAAVTAQVAAVSVPQPPQTPASTEPEWPSDEQIATFAPEVAAIYKIMKSGGRGRGRGQNQQTSNFGTRGGGRGGRGNGRGGRGGGQTWSKDNPRWKGPRHSDLPPFGACRKHWD